MKAKSFMGPLATRCCSRPARSLNSMRRAEERRARPAKSRQAAVAAGVAEHR